MVKFIKSSSTILPAEKMQNKQNYNIIKISFGILVTRTVILTLVIQNEKPE
jgi:hypothetical protein